MKARITVDGFLEVEPTTSTEAFALKAWVESQNIQLVACEPFRATIVIKPFEIKSTGDKGNFR